MQQLPLHNLPEIAPDVQLAAARRLQRMVSAKRRSFATRDFARRRTAMLKVTRNQGEATC